jgi:hypothetical protein
LSTFWKLYYFALGQVGCQISKSLSNRVLAIRLRVLFVCWAFHVLCPGFLYSWESFWNVNFLLVFNLLYPSLHVLHVVDVSEAIYILLFDRIILNRWAFSFIWILILNPNGIEWIDLISFLTSWERLLFLELFLCW